MSDASKRMTRRPIGSLIVTEGRRIGGFRNIVLSIGKPPQNSADSRRILSSCGQRQASGGSDSAAAARGPIWLGQRGL